MKTNHQTRSPIIGISGNLLSIESGSFQGHERSAVVHDYILAVEQAEGVPFILPVIEKKDFIEQQMSLIDGLLLSGGYDPSPLFYGDEPQKELEAVCPRRDVYEIELVHLAYRLNKPILAICRGLQILNVAFGGTLYQDIHSSLPSSLQHYSKAKPVEATHHVEIIPNTILHKIFDQQNVLTNSFHHQAIKKVAPNLIVNSQTKDGVIEGVEGDKDHFILGLQWHPELMINKHPSMLKLFQAFVEASRKRES